MVPDSIDGDYMRLSCRKTRTIAAHLVAVVAVLLYAQVAVAQTWRPAGKSKLSIPARYKADRWKEQRAERLSQRVRAITVAESEPNDSASVANPVVVGDVITGTINPTNDEDWFAVTLTAGTVVDLDVDAEVLGSPLDPILGLINPAADTLLAFNDDSDGLDSHITFQITTTARYFVAIADFSGAGSSSHSYTLKITTLAPGPGDPTTLFASSLGVPFGFAAGAGDFFVTDLTSDRILRVSAQGVVTTFTQGGSIESPVDVVLDAFGNLLVAGLNPSGAGGQVVRVTPSAQQSVFLTSAEATQGITVGPDGDVWVGDSAFIRRYGPDGAPKQSISTGASGGVYALAFSPSGELHFSNGTDGVFKIVNNTVQRVITADPYLEGLAFDASGNLYVANGFEGTVLLYGPTYSLILDPFARTNLGGPTSLTFGRDASGAMTSRLFATNVGFGLQGPFIGSMVEMNRTGVRSPGFRIGLSLPPVAEIASHLLGATTTLTPALQQLLDGQGNRNGRFDVGDFRAYLRNLGQIQAAGAARSSTRQGGKKP
jgi:sugar lactone lactonase YvrE